MVTDTTCHDRIVSDQQITTGVGKIWEENKPMFTFPAVVYVKNTLPAVVSYDVHHCVLIEWPHEDGEEVTGCMAAVLIPMRAYGHQR